MQFKFAVNFTTFKMFLQFFGYNLSHKQKFKKSFT